MTTHRLWHAVRPENSALRENVLCLDVNGACAGFIYGCSLADGFLAREGGYGLIIGSEKISPLMDMEDRSTCVLFGDGAGAAVVEYSDSVQFAYLGGVCSEQRNSPLRRRKRQDRHVGAGSISLRCE